MTRHCNDAAPLVQVTGRTKSRWRIKDPFCGWSHWFGAALSLVGLVVLLDVSASSRWRAMALGVYGLTLIVLYTSSALAHSISGSPRVQDRLTRLDCAAIFLLIAGTYTPVCAIAVGGAWGWGILAAEWMMAFAGIAMLVLGRGRSTLPRTVLYLCMGWLGLLAGLPVIRALSGPALGWLFAGGAAYSVGAVIFVTNRPHPWPGRFHAHDLWHVLVLVGSACHFILILCFIAQ